MTKTIFYDKIELFFRGLASMTALQNLEFNRPKLLDDAYHFQGQPQRIYIKKTQSNDKAQYFLHLILPQEEVQTIKQGYLYFYFHEETQTSNFIGLYIHPEYRNQGLSSLLISNWIKFCLDQDITLLGVNRKQKKPFLLYALKKYQFEIANPMLYQTDSNTIHICQKEKDATKYLLFESEKQKELFQKGRTIHNDNDHVLDRYDENIPVIDHVLLTKKYTLQDPNKAYQKAIGVIEKHR